MLAGADDWGLPQKAAAVYSVYLGPGLASQAMSSCLSPVAEVVSSCGQLQRFANFGREIRVFSVR